MKRMTSDEIINLLDHLIWQTTAVGDSAIDHVIKENLKTLIDVTNWCLNSVARSAKTRHRFESSMRNIGEWAFAALDEWRNWLDERIKED